MTAPTQPASKPAAQASKPGARAKGQPQRNAKANANGKGTQPKVSQSAKSLDDAARSVSEHGETPVDLTQHAAEENRRTA